MKPLTATTKKLEYRNRFMDVYHTTADFGGFRKDYFVIELGPRVGVVAVKQSHVLLTRQYRFLIDAMSWELPGGKVEATESPQEAAARECLEETGVRCRKLDSLIVYYPGLDNLNNPTTLFYTEDFDEVRRFASNHSEVVEIAWKPLDECLAMIFSGEILDALTVAGILAYRARRDGV
jgi:ADP-ribose pyrophosphatase